YIYELIKVWHSVVRKKNYYYALSLVSFFVFVVYRVLMLLVLITKAIKPVILLKLMTSSAMV
ncbi:hypothetical protein, partial [Psychrobacter sanguinis]|uniref:hypothetical protein n=1 Tax=Psychrobacter sanguinis TaxID=861445 RepID=UPI0036303A0D